MIKCIKKMVCGLLVVTCLSLPTVSVKGETIGINNSEISNEILPKIVVSRYVDIEEKYLYIGDVPKYYPYSFYDYGYKTTLHGTLVLYAVENFDSYVVAYYSGYCSGSI